MVPNKKPSPIAIVHEDMDSVSFSMDVLRKVFASFARDENQPVSAMVISARDAFKAAVKAAKSEDKAGLQNSVKELIVDLGLIASYLRKSECVNSEVKKSEEKKSYTGQSKNISENATLPWTLIASLESGAELFNKAAGFARSLPETRQYVEPLAVLAAKINEAEEFRWR